MRVGITSLKGAPGATTFATCLAAVWPNPRRILVEVDNDGVCLAARFASVLGESPDIADLVVECRHTVDHEAVLRHTQSLFGFDVIVGSADPRRAHSSTRELGPIAAQLPSVMPDTDWLFDLGRYRAGPVAQLATELDGILLCTRLNFESMAGLAGRVSEICAWGAPTAVVGIGRSDFDQEEVDATLRRLSDNAVALAGVIPFDPRSATAWNGSATSNSAAKAMLRSRMVTAAKHVAQRVIDTTVEIRL